MKNLKRSKKRSDAKTKSIFSLKSGSNRLIL